MKSFVPDTFVVPTLLETASFRLRPLMISDVVKDYDAVMTSIDHLHTCVPAEVFGAVWPAPDMTIEDDLADLGWHQVEFKNRTSFTYTVMNPNGSRCLGCVYVFPPRFTDADAEVFLWVRQSEVSRGLDHKLYDAVKHWMESAWPFRTTAFPFRETKL